MDDLAVILPVYNERGTVEKVLQEWKKELNKYKIKYRFIICEDGSTDGTSQLLKKIQKKYQLILNQVKHRRGYGKAVLDGIKSANSKYILNIDSDGQCHPKDFSKFWRNKDKADIIIGWRRKRADPFHRKIFSFMFKCVFKILFPTKIHDPSAPFVLYKRKTILPYLKHHLKYLQYLKEGFWWGFIGTAVKKKLIIYEIPINHRKRLKGKTVVYKPGKILSIGFKNLIGLIMLRKQP